MSLNPNRSWAGDANPKYAHGKHGSELYAVWKSMRDRCNNPNSAQFEDYAGRGIAVDPRWDSFENFLADMGPRPAGMTLEREDNDKGYGPGNCRWASRLDQTLNRRRTVWVDVGGERLCLKHAAPRLGVSEPTLRKRLRAEGKM